MRVRLTAYVGACSWLVFSLIGCAGGGVELVPVEGMALVDDAPVKDGKLMLKADATKGNTTTLVPLGISGGDGKYKVYTDQKPGAPPGWYKVVVIATEPIDPKDLYAPRKSYIHEKYNAETTTDLAIEVKANAPAGSYDLKMKK